MLTPGVDDELLVGTDQHGLTLFTYHRINSTGMM